MEQFATARWRSMTQGESEKVLWDGEVVEGDIVIGCDGVRSVVREAIDVGSNPVVPVAGHKNKDGKYVLLSSCATC